MTEIAPPVAKACPECPFNRKCKPGTLGGSSVETYVGQINGPFTLACHMHCDFSDPNWNELSKYKNTPQCAGAAIMRSNLGIADRMPAALPRLPADRENVFATMSEFARHHRPNAYPGEARRFDSRMVIDMLVRDQIDKFLAGQKP